MYKCCSKINLRLADTYKPVAIAPQRTRSSNRYPLTLLQTRPWLILFTSVRAVAAPAGICKVRDKTSRLLLGTFYQRCNQNVKTRAKEQENLWTPCVAYWWDTKRLNTLKSRRWSLLELERHGWTSCVSQIGSACCRDASRDWITHTHTDIF